MSQSVSYLDGRICLPKLYARSSSGKTKWWEVSVVKDIETYGAYYVHVYHGYTDTLGEGAHFTHITSGKNIGKANETTPLQQANILAQSKWNKQIDKGYTESITEDTRLLLPMLAHSYEKKKHKITFPCYVQPKLNGVRCLAEKVSEDKIVYHSRQGKEFADFPQITKELLESLSVGEVFDGELYVHGWTFQKIVSAVKDVGSPDRQNLQYWIYDVVDLELTFEERNIFRSENISSLRLHVINVIDDFPQNEERFLKLHAYYSTHGYEGTILRNRDGLYKCGQRSVDLQKYKDFVDSEFEIIGGDKDAYGGVVFRCKTEDGKEFSVRPTGTDEQRTHMFSNLAEYIGKTLTVKYQNLSEDGIPIFPVGLGVRDYE